jgi:hypothetical protein
VFSGGFQDAGFEVNSNYHLLFDSCHSAYTDRPYTFRYRLHQAYRQWLPDFTGQLLQLLKGIAEEGDVLESTLWVHQPKLDEKKIQFAFVRDFLSPLSVDVLTTRFGIDIAHPRRRRVRDSTPFCNRRKPAVRTGFTQPTHGKRACRRSTTSCRTWWSGLLSIT